MAKRLKQQKIPGTEGDTIPEIDKAAENYVELRDERVKLLGQEIEAGDNLLALMREHKLESYEFDGKLVNITHKDKVRVKRKKDAEEEDEDDGD